MKNFNIGYQLFRKPSNPSLILLFAIPVCLFLVLYVGFGFNGLYGQDSHTYLKYSNQIKDWLLSGTQIDQYFWPKGYPFIGWILSLSVIPLKFSMQIVSLLAAIGALFFAHKIITLLFDQDSSWWLIIGAASSVYFIRSSTLIMSDMLAAFFLLISYYNYLKSLQSSQKKFWIYFLVFYVLAIYTRYPTILFGLIPAGQIIHHLTKGKKIWLKIVLFGSFTIGLIIIIFSNNEMYNLGTRMFKQWHIVNYFKNEFSTSSGQVTFNFPNLIQVFSSSFHPGYLSIGIFLIPFFKKIRSANRVILTSVLLYYLFVAGLEIQNYRFFVISHPFVLISLFPLYHSLHDWLKNRRALTIFLFLTLAANTFIFIYSFSKTYDAHLTEKEICLEIKILNPKGTIYSFGVDQSFPSYGIENAVENFYYKLIDSFETNALVVFNENKYMHQWNKTNVMKNWHRLNQHYELIPLVEVRSGWVIYQINSEDFK